MLHDNDVLCLGTFMSFKTKLTMEVTLTLTDIKHGGAKTSTYIIDIVYSIQTHVHS